MPFVAGALNIGWEVCALISSGGYWGHIVWLILDLAVLSYNIYILYSLRQRFSYVILVLVCGVMLHRVFLIPSIDGMLISSFVIDIIMALEYIVMIKHVSPRGRLLIGVLRLLGDAFAWVENLRHSKCVLIIGIMVLLANIFYCCYCLELEGMGKTKKKK